MNLIQTLEEEMARRAESPGPSFMPGDTVVVNVNVLIEGEHQARAGCMRAWSSPSAIAASTPHSSSRRFHPGKAWNARFRPSTPPTIASIEVKRRGSGAQYEALPICAVVRASRHIKEKLDYVSTQMKERKGRVIWSALLHCENGALQLRVLHSSTDRTCQQTYLGLHCSRTNRSRTSAPAVENRG